MRGGLYPGVSRFTDRSGRARYRYRKKGFPARMLQADFGSAEFDAEYKACLQGGAPLKCARVKGRIRRKRPVNQTLGYIYFISAKNGPVKIGFSTNPEQRLRTISKHHAETMMLLAVTPGTMETEFELHQRWAKQRIRGEWFARTAELMRDINAIADGKLNWQTAISEA